MWTPGQRAIRYFVPHEGKYFLWMKRIQAGAAPAGTGQWFTEFETFGPPLTLTPVGELAAYSKIQITAAENAPPTPVRASREEDATFVATFASGSVVRIKRMRADDKS